MVNKIPSGAQSVNLQALSAQAVLKKVGAQKLPNPVEASKTHQLFSKLKDVLLGKNNYINFTYNRSDGKQTSPITISITGSRREIKELKQLIKGGKIQDVAAAVSGLVEKQLNGSKLPKPNSTKGPNYGKGFWSKEIKQALHSLAPPPFELYQGPSVYPDAPPKGSLPPRQSTSKEDLEQSKLYEQRQQEILQGHPNAPPASLPEYNIGTPGSLQPKPSAPTPLKSNGIPDSHLQSQIAARQAKIAKDLPKVEKKTNPSNGQTSLSNEHESAPASAPTPSFTPMDSSRVDHSALKRATIDLLISKHQHPGEDPVSAAIAQAGLSNAMNIPQLIAELSTLYPEKSESERAGMRVALTTQWMSLEAGHEWGIKMNYSIGGTTQTTDGNYSEVTNGKASILVSDFLKAEGRELGLSSKGQEKMEQAALAGAKAAQITLVNAQKNNHDLTNPQSNLSTGIELRRDLDQNGIVTLPAGWSGHIVGLTLHKAADGKYFLYYCNRGGAAFEKADDRALMGGQGANSYNMVCYEIGDPSALTPELLGQIVGSLRYHLDPQITNDFAKPFIEGKSGLFEKLKLKKAAEIPKTAQKGGNCSWANCKGSIHATAIAAAYDDLVASNPQGQSTNMLNSAIHTGSAIFKKMERFGRKQSLGPILKYDGTSPGALVAPFDHMRMLSSASIKLAKKAAEGGKETQSTDQEMLLQISASFNSCPYSISSISHKNLGTSSSESLQSALKEAGDGSYAFVANQCWVCVNGQVVSIEIDTSQQLGDCLKLLRQNCPDIGWTNPVFLDKSKFTPTQEAASDCVRQIRNSAVKLRDFRVTHEQQTSSLKNQINEDNALLHNPNTTEEQKTFLINRIQSSTTDLAQLEAQFEQGNQALRQELNQSLKTVQRIPNSNPPSQDLMKLKSEASALADRAIRDAFPPKVSAFLTRLDDLVFSLK